MGRADADAAVNLQPLVRAEFFRENNGPCSKLYRHELLPGV